MRKRGSGSRCPAPGHRRSPVCPNRAPFPAPRSHRKDPPACKLALLRVGGWASENGRGRPTSAPRPFRPNRKTALATGQRHEHRQRICDPYLPEQEAPNWLRPSPCSPVRPRLLCPPPASYPRPLPNCGGASRILFQMADLGVPLHCSIFVAHSAPRVSSTGSGSRQPAECPSERQAATA